jgi:hypothetical protein
MFRDRLKAEALLAAISGTAALDGGAAARPAKIEKAATAAGMKKRCIVIFLPMIFSDETNGLKSASLPWAASRKPPRHFEALWIKHSRPDYVPVVRKFAFDVIFNSLLIIDIFSPLARKYRDLLVRRKITH